MDRVVSQLLAEIDGINAAGGDLFVIGATNRPDLLDPALLRPGRLDALLYVGIAEEPEAKERVLRALTRRFALEPGLDLSSLAAACPVTLTGADLYALCADAWMLAMRRSIAAHEQRQQQQLLQAGASAEHLQRQEGAAAAGEAVPQAEEPPSVVVTLADFRAALAALTPSLSKQELQRYQRLRDHYEGQRGGRAALGGSSGSSGTSLLAGRTGS